MKHLIEYNAAPAADRFREVDAAELGEIIREIRQSEASASTAGDFYYDNWRVDIAAATRAAELQDAFGERIFVARDEDGFYFAHEPQETNSGRDRMTYTSQQERFAKGGANSWNRVSVLGEIRDCEEDAADLQAIAEIEKSEHIAVRACRGCDCEILEFINEAAAADAEEAFWRDRANEQGVRL